MRTIKTNAKQTLFYIFSFVLFLTFGCKKDQVEPVTNPPAQNDEELITTFKMTFVDSAGIEADKVFLFRDVDGPGGNPPSQFDTIRISNNKTYLVALELLNESLIPTDDITAEILAEAQEHLFCFDPTLGANLMIQRTDSDGTYEIGLASKWKTISTSNDQVLIKLKHQPGVKNGQCDPGETDIELNFQVEIQ